MTCPWNNSGDRIPLGTCPVLWHTLYPYFLGFVFGAKFSPEGPANVGCPAEYGIDLVVSVKPWDVECPPWVPTDWRDVIQAEVVAVNGPCPHGYRVGDRVFFPTYAKQAYACPAGVHNLSLFVTYEHFPCLNKKRVRCPDWKENIYFSLED
jgi:uncharacterized repeat protein (TIGR04076 family)